MLRIIINFVIKLYNFFFFCHRLCLPVEPHWKVSDNQNTDTARQSTVYMTVLASGFRWTSRRMFRFSEMVVNNVAYSIILALFDILLIERMKRCRTSPWLTPSLLATSLWQVVSNIKDMMSTSNGSERNFRKSSTSLFRQISGSSKMNWMRAVALWSR